jgi:hypothetical protein
MESTPKKRKFNQDEIPRITFYDHMLTMIINEQQTMPYYLSYDCMAGMLVHHLNNKALFVVHL